MIACHQYDYVEIACMYKFPILLTLKSGVNLEGVAHDTKINDKNEECLILTTENEDKVIVLNDIAKMEVQIENPHFKLINFE